MATVGRIQTPIQNPLTLENMRREARQNKLMLMTYPGTHEVSNIGQQLGATLADPFGFKATIDEYNKKINDGIPTFLVGAAVLIVGIMLIWAGLNAFILPAATKVAATAAKVAG